MLAVTTLTCVLLPPLADSELLLFCSSQLKLLQLYSNIQELHEAEQSPAPPPQVDTNAHRGCVNQMFSFLMVLKHLRAVGKFDR